MFTLLRTIPPRRIPVEQMPSIAAAWLAAERFCKFRSVCLECTACQAIWFVFDALMPCPRRPVLALRRGPAPSTGN